MFVPNYPFTFPETEIIKTSSVYANSRHHEGWIWHVHAWGLLFWAEYWVYLSFSPLGQENHVKPRFSWGGATISLPNLAGLGHSSQWHAGGAQWDRSAHPTWSQGGIHAFWVLAALFDRAPAAVPLPAHYQRAVLQSWIWPWDPPVLQPRALPQANGMKLGEKIKVHEIQGASEPWLCR